MARSPARRGHERRALDDSALDDARGVAVERAGPRVARGRRSAAGSRHPRASTERRADGRPPAPGSRAAARGSSPATAARGRNREHVGRRDPLGESALSLGYRGERLRRGAQVSARHRTPADVERARELAFSSSGLPSLGSRLSALRSSDPLARPGRGKPKGLLVPGLPADLVDVAPAPVLAGLGRPDQRMARLLEVSVRVPMGRVVAAPDLPAAEAHPQVHPPASDLQALLTPRHGRR